MLRTRFTLALLACLLPVPLSPAHAGDPPLAEAVGRVISFEQATGILALNTRLGREEFSVSDETLVLLNNHAADTGDIRRGDRARVTYRFDTSEAVIVHLTREAALSGRVVRVTGSSIEVRVGRGAVVSLRPDANSRVELEGIPLEEHSVLVGLRVEAVYEPETFLLLALDGDAPVARGVVSAVDAKTRTLSISGARARTFAVDQAATVRRDGASATLASVAVGDRVRVAFVREGGSLRALAIRAQSSAP